MIKRYVLYPIEGCSICKLPILMHRGDAMITEWPDDGDGDVYYYHESCWESQEGAKYHE